jgi:hypothetical protein
MSSRPKGNRSTGPQATTIQGAEIGEASVGTSAYIMYAGSPYAHVHIMGRP